jgi:hypothetical protein
MVMRFQTLKLWFLALCIAPVLSAFNQRSHAQNSGQSFPAVTPKTWPKTWDDEALASLEVPLPEASYSPRHVSSDYYYRIPARAIYKSYPVYHPDKEPPGYMDWLRQQEPEVIFDPAKFKTEEDWIRAGEAVFDFPIDYVKGIELTSVREPAWYKTVRMPVAQNGVFPFGRYVIREKGVVELGVNSCAQCHTRVMSDGSLIKGAQGNFPLDRVLGYEFPIRAAKASDKEKFMEELRRGELQDFDAPWLRPGLKERLAQMSVEDLAAARAAIPEGVLARQRSSVFYPPHIPDLIGVKDQRYLDSAGLVRHRTIADLMRYAALNQGGDSLSRFGEFIPGGVDFKTLPDPGALSRFSDEQLYALALYLYSLKPPPNPNKFDALARRGQRVFDREGCAACHTPPLYTNNKLTPAEGFKAPQDHLKKFDILPLSVGTDPNLTLKTRRGTGYYKVPSLRGVWYRGPFEHNGSVATLEDFFDPKRLRDDYTPTGFIGYGVKTRAVKGHEFGLKLPADDKKALIAFLKTL